VAGVVWRAWAPLSAGGVGGWRLGGRGRISEPGVPAEAEGAVDQGLVAADRGAGADLEVGPAQLVFDLFVALLDPVPDPVHPHHLGQARGRVRAASLAWAAGEGRLVTRYQVALGGRVGGGHHQAPGTFRSPAPRVAAAANQVSVCPPRKVLVTACQSPGSSGPSQARSRAASTGVRASGP
jgi:hypothetical protein